MNGVGLRAELREERAHEVRTERAVEADGERLDVLRRRSRTRSTVCAEIIVSPPRPTAAEIMIGQADLVLGEDFLDGDERGLGVERVEDRLDEQQVRRRRR
jgi:hypothetical protein